jgi:hypothetical protein
VYRFCGSAGDVVNVAVTTTSGVLSPEVKILDPTGAMVCQAAGGYCVYGTAEIGSCALTSSGTYTILLDDCGNAKTGNYNLYLQRLNRPGDAVPFAFGATVTAAIGAAAEKDTSTFSAASGDAINVAVTTTSGTLSPEVKIVDSVGAVVCQASGGYCVYGTAEIGNCALSSNGTYTILLDDCGNAKTGSYNIYLQRLNDPEQATVIGPGTIEGRIDVPAEKDAYTFFATSAGSIRVTMTTSSGSLSPDVKVIDQNGVVLCAAAGSYCVYGTAEIASCSVSAPGRYSIIADDCGNGKTGDYDLTLTCITASCEAVDTPTPTPGSNAATPTFTPFQTPTGTPTLTPTSAPTATATATWTPTTPATLAPTFTPTRSPSPTTPAPSPTTPAPVDLVADALEVTQAVQNLNNSVALVANKRTFVRFHVHSTGGEYATTAQLQVQSGSQSVEVAPQNPGGMITVRLAPNRAVLDHAFLFALPSGFESGTVQLTAELNPNGDPVETNLVNNTAEAAVAFEDVPQQNLVLYSVGYGSSAAPDYPPDIDRTQMVLWLQRAFPISDLQVTERTYFAGANVPTCGQVNSYLLSKRLWDLAYSPSLPANTRYYGMVDDAGVNDASGFMRGCAAGIPSFVASGPTGVPTGNFSWDTDGTYGDWYGGHELGHAWGRYHAEFCGAQGGQPYPYPDGRISPTLTGSSAMYGFDVFTRAIYEPSWKDIMTYCEYEWVSDFTYERLLGFFKSGAGAGAVARDVSVMDRLLVVGTIDPTNNSVELQPLFVVHNAGELKARIPGDYAIVLRNDAGTELQRYPFTPDVGEGGADDSEREVQILFINELVPYADGTTRVDIEGPSGLLKSVTAGLSDPTVQILSAEGGSAAAIGEMVTLSWEANDSDGDPLSFNVQYSPDNGQTWETIEQNLTGNSVDIDVRNLTRSNQALFRVVATDGIHTSTSTPSEQFQVPNHPPTARIVAPARPPSGPAIHFADTPLSLCVQVSDPDGDPVTVTWSSSVDGSLGSGTCITVAQLSVDLHTITATGADGKDGTAGDTIQVQVYCFAKCGPSGCTPCPTPRPDELSVAPALISCPGASLAIENKNPTQAIDWYAGYVAQPWVHLCKGSGQTPDSVTLICTAGGLPPAGRSADISFFTTGAGPVTAVVQQTGAACRGDCDGGGGVTVNEILTMVNIALGNSEVSQCTAGDTNGDCQITIDEILTAVNNALSECG